MVVDIYAHILRPGRVGDYFVIVSAFPFDSQESIGNQPQKARTATTLQEAETTRSELVQSLQEIVEERGDVVRQVHFK
ncbi:MAG TPA: hypothetical protein VN878_06440 [Usitatibacter sp.]|nr:hypothetical protein [Usitatibacter sp.]